MTFLRLCAETFQPLEVREDKASGHKWKNRTMSTTAYISICKYPNIRSVNVIAAEKVKLQLSWLKEVLCELSLLKIFSYQGLNMINWEARGRPITLRNYIILKKIINAYYFQKRIVLNLISILFFCRSLQVVTQIWKTDKLKIVVNPTWYILHFLSLVVSKLLAGSLIEIIRALKSMKNN